MSCETCKHFYDCDLTGTYAECMTRDYELYEAKEERLPVRKGEVIPDAEVNLAAVIRGYLGPEDNFVLLFTTMEEAKDYLTTKMFTLGDKVREADVMVDGKSVRMKRREFIPYAIKHNGIDFTWNGQKLNIYLEDASKYGDTDSVRYTVIGDILKGNSFEFVCKFYRSREEAIAYLNKRLDVYLKDGNSYLVRGAYDKDHNWVKSIIRKRLSVNNRKEVANASELFMTCKSDRFALAVSNVLKDVYKGRY